MSRIRVPDNLPKIKESAEPLDVTMKLADGVECKFRVALMGENSVGILGIDNGGINTQEQWEVWPHRYQYMAVTNGVVSYFAEINGIDADSLSVSGTMDTRE